MLFFDDIGYMDERKEKQLATVWLMRKLIEMCVCVFLHGVYAAETNCCRYVVKHRILILLGTVQQLYWVIVTCRVQISEHGVCNGKGFQTKQLHQIRFDVCNLNGCYKPRKQLFGIWKAVFPNGNNGLLEDERR